MESLSLQMKMNILGSFQSQKPMAETMMPNPLTAPRKPSVASAEALVAYSLTFANMAIGGRIEEVVHPHYILWTGVS